MKPAAFLAGLVPAAWLVWAGLTGNLSANPLSDITNETGLWALRFSVHHAGDHAAAPLTGWNVVIRFRRMAGLFAFFYGTLHFLTYVDRRSLRQPSIFPTASSAWTTVREPGGVGRRGHLQAAVHHRRLHGVRADVPLALTSTAG